MFRIAFYGFVGGSSHPVQQEQGIEMNDRVDQAARRAVSSPQKKQENATPAIDMIDWAKRLN
ncbi:MAG: hypothetical protein ABSA17_04885 [Rhabdochlamydiaceae bacterium]|jgi:hypothetical protein